MAIVQNPLINRASGSVGNSVFSKWKKLNTIKSKSITPYPEPTQSQLRNRNIFKKAQLYVSQMSVAKNFIFLSPSAKISYNNYLCSVLMSCIDIDSLLPHVLMFPILLLSKGVLPFHFEFVLSISETKFVAEGNTPLIPKYPEEEMEGLLMMYREETDTWMFFSPDYFVDCYHSIEFDLSLSPIYTTHVFYILTSLQHRQSANSVYLGTVSY